jgi:hypothetical protein
MTFTTSTQELHSTGTHDVDGGPKNDERSRELEKGRT